jgi:hypothetical protein
VKRFSCTRGKSSVPWSAYDAPDISKLCRLCYKPHTCVDEGPSNGFPRPPCSRKIGRTLCRAMTSWSDSSPVPVMASVGMLLDSVTGIRTGEGLLGYVIPGSAVYRKICCRAGKKNDLLSVGDRIMAKR